MKRYIGSALILATVILMALPVSAAMAAGPDNSAGKVPVVLGPVEGFTGEFPLTKNCIGYCRTTGAWLGLNATWSEHVLSHTRDAHFQDPGTPWDTTGGPSDMSTMLPPGRAK